MLVTQSCSDSLSPRRVTVTGTVALGDAWANYLTDHSGVAVSIDGLPAMAVTDTLGTWHIDGVPVGRHDFAFTKATFATVRLPGLSVDSGATVPDVFMPMTPWQQAVIDSIHLVTRAGHDVYLVDGHLAAPPPSNALFGTTVVFVGRSPNVSPEISSYDQWNIGVDHLADPSTFSIELRRDATQSTFGVGATVFAAAYAVSATCSCYTSSPDPKPFFPTTGPRANVVPLKIQ